MLWFADGLVSINDAGYLEAYTTTTGTVRWKRAIAPEYGSNAEDGVLYVESSPAFQRDKVVSMRLMPILVKYDGPGNVVLHHLPF